MRSHWAGHAEGDGFQYIVSATEVEALLANAPEFSGVYNGTEPGQFEMHVKKYAWATHTCRAILITPLAPPDTAESLLRDLVALRGYEEDRTAFERAKAFLARLDGEGK